MISPEISVNLAGIHSYRAIEQEVLIFISLTRFTELRCISLFYFCIKN